MITPQDRLAGGYNNHSIALCVCQCGSFGAVRYAWNHNEGIAVQNFIISTPCAAIMKNNQKWEERTSAASHNELYL